MTYHVDVKKIDGVFYDVSEPIPREVIKACVRTCEKQNCCLSGRVEQSTLEGGSRKYTKDAIMEVSMPWRATFRVGCTTCFGVWEVAVKGISHRED